MRQRRTPSGLMGLLVLVAGVALGVPASAAAHSSARIADSVARHSRACPPESLPPPRPGPGHAPGAVAPAMAVPERLLPHRGQRPARRGATLWTDFVYDDHGPFGSPIGIADAAQASDLAPVHGGFSYPSGPADQNGADIFTAAVGYTPQGDLLAGGLEHARQTARSRSPSGR